MANIAITNYCNLKCSYCFADDMIHEPNKNMLVEDYIKILKYLVEKNNVTYLGIIGGEPTLHPDFREILCESNQCANRNNIQFTLFTNGIELEQYLQYIGNSINILINCNNFINMSFTQVNKFHSTIKHLSDLGWLHNKKANLGCNIYMEEYNYDWIWMLVDTYHIQSLRCSVVSPGGKYVSWRTKKDEYFKIMKPIFLNFCKQAQKRKVTLNMDCSCIPNCYFTEEELLLVKEVISNDINSLNIGCEPVMDITPNLNVTPCFGLYKNIPLDFNKNWMGFIKYILYNYNIPKALHNNQGPCATCDKLCEFQCQGGCLAFSSLE